MLQQLDLKFFKCFKELSLPLAPLTLLSGRNAAGKSTVMQALALLHQTITTSAWLSELILDGPVLSVGGAADVLDKLWGRGNINIGIHHEDYVCDFLLQLAERQAVTIPIKKLTWKSTSSGKTSVHIPPINLWEDQPFSGGPNQFAADFQSLSYISAERLGPRETYPLSTPSHHQQVGTRGERTVGLLHWHGDREVGRGKSNSNRCLDPLAPSLRSQTQAWLDRFFPGASFQLNPVPGANLVTLGLRTSEDTDYHRPQNVGYGLSHILPILAGCLHANPGQVVLVENPEAHLHPAGQALMGEFLAQNVAAGVQIIVETHSDHVLSGIRRCVRDRLLIPEQIALHFFNPRRDPPHPDFPQLVSPQLDPKGNLDHWPEGFFDQFDKDMNYLAGWGSV